MEPWPKHPIIYEINTWIWLHELSERYGQIITLANVPEEEWNLLYDLKIDALWCMGVWERSPAGMAIANRNEELLADFRQVLPDFQEADNVGSPYCVRQYEVNTHLGGSEGLAAARTELSRRGIKLILDFVPNHTAPDHPWVSEHPDYYIQGDDSDFSQDPDSFTEVNGKIFACGRDPNFPPWPDVLQLNVFNQGLRRAAINTLRDIARQCDGVRCDMAILPIHNIFERTWGQRAGSRPCTEYWTEVIQAIRGEYRDFLFMAEAYWDLEWELQQQGFDYCYDKRLYERMEQRNAENIRLHLCADPVYQEKLVRFIENHDEPRAAATFSNEERNVVSMAMATLPGAKLFHEGQFEGRTVKVPVFLGRRPPEKIDRHLQEFYRRLLDTVSVPALRSGEWQLCERTGWPENQSYQNLIAWCWRREDEKCLIIVNLSGSHVQGRVVVPWEEIKGTRWQLLDVFAEDIYERDGSEMCDPGLYVDLGPWEFHFLRFF